MARRIFLNQRCKSVLCCSFDAFALQDVHVEEDIDGEPLDDDQARPAATGDSVSCNRPQCVDANWRLLMSLRDVTR